MFLLADKLWVLAMLVGAVGLLGLLHVIAIGVENQVKAHDLRVKVNSLRQQQLDRLKEREDFRQSMMTGSSKPASPFPQDAPTAAMEAQAPAGELKKAA